MRKLTVLLTLVVLLPQSGCTFAKLIGLVGTPSEHEKKVPAEYELAKRKGQKIFVLVHEPGWLGAQVNLRYYLTEAMNEYLQKKVKTAPDYLTGYNELSEFRSNHANFSLLSAVEVGAALDAGVVLLVVVEDCELNKISEIDYYKGFLDARTVLLDVATGEKLWPESAESKTVRVGFEMESGGQAAAVRRLAAAGAHCTVRYFYNCPKDKFKIPDDRSDVAWENWKK